MAKKGLVKEDALQTAREWMKRHTVVEGQASTGPTEQMVLNMMAGGINAAYCSIGRGEGGGDHSTPEGAMLGLLPRHWLVKHMPYKVALATSVADIERARNEGKVAIIYGWQRGSLLERDFRWLEVFHMLGLRILNFTYNEENCLGYGCLDPHDWGLKRFGHVILQDCNYQRILVDCSHSGERTSLDVIERSEYPCVFSHSNPKGVRDNPRNISDDQIRACAAKGGVVGCTQFADFVADTSGGRQPTLDDWVKCVDYAVNLAGIDHVGIATDMVPASFAVGWNNGTRRRNRDICGGMTFDIHDVEGMDHSHANFPLLVAPLIERGYKEEDVAKIIGGNWLRVYQAAWGT